MEFESCVEYRVTRIGICSMVHACPEIACVSVAFPLPERALFRTVLAGPGGSVPSFGLRGYWNATRMVRDVRIDDKSRVIKVYTSQYPTVLLTPRGVGDVLQARVT